MTQNGVNELYQYLGAAWPLVIRPGADETWKRVKMRELFQTYRDYDDAEVLEAFQKWTEQNEKFPTTKNIINEIKWVQAKKHVGNRENVELWQAPRWIHGQETLIMHDGKIQWKRDEFVQQPWNPEHLQPEEWERRFMATRQRDIQKQEEQS
jgi:hypothetical protein